MQRKRTAPRMAFMVVLGAALSGGCDLFFPIHDDEAGGEGGADVAPEDVRSRDRVAADGGDADADAEGPPGAVRYVQDIAGHALYPPKSNAVTIRFPKPNRQGGLLLVSIGYALGDAGVPMVFDSNVNAYHPVLDGGPVRWAADFAEDLFYAEDVAAGSNQVTVAFAALPSGFFEVRAFEYEGVAASSPLDVAGVVADAGSWPAVTLETTTGKTSADGELLFAIGQLSLLQQVASCETTPGKGFSLRSVDAGGQVVVEDRVGGPAGTEQASALENCPGATGVASWILISAAFRPAR